MKWVLLMSMAAVMGAAFQEVHGYDCEQAFPPHRCTNCWGGAPWLTTYVYNDGSNLFDSCDARESECEYGGGFDGDYVDFLCADTYDWSYVLGERMSYHGNNQPTDNKAMSGYQQFRRFCNGTTGNWSTHVAVWDDNGGPEGKGGYRENYNKPLPACATEGDGQWSSSEGDFGTFTCCERIPYCKENREEIFPHLIGKGRVTTHNEADDSMRTSAGPMSGAEAILWCDGEDDLEQHNTYGVDHRVCVCPDYLENRYDCHFEDVFYQGGALENYGRCQSCVPFDEPADIVTTYSNNDKEFGQNTGHYDSTTASFEDNCPEGYAMYPSADDATIMCDSGSWDGDPPSCVAECNPLNLTDYPNIAAVYTDGNNPGSAAQFYCTLDGESTDNDDRTLTCTDGEWEGDLSGLACTPCAGTNPKTGEVFTGADLSGPWHLYNKDHLGSVSVALNDANVWEASFSCKGSNFRFFEDGGYASGYENKVLTCRNGVWSDESRDASYDGQLPYCCRQKSRLSTEFKRCCTRSGGEYTAGYCSGSSALTAGAGGSGVLIAAVDEGNDDDDDDKWRPFEVYLSVMLTAVVVLIGVGVLIVARRPSGAAPPPAAVLSGPGSEQRRGSEFSMHHIDHHRVDDHDELHPMDSPTGRESPSNLLTPAGPAKRTTISEL